MSIFSRYFLSIFILMTVVLALVSMLFMVSSGRIVDDMGAASSATMAQAFTRHIEKQGANLAGVVAEAIITPVMLREYETIGEILSAAKSQHLVERVVVYDDVGKIIHDGTEALSDRGKNVVDLFGLDDPFTHTVVWDNAHSLLYCFAPVKIKSTILGGVVIGLTLKAMNEPVQALRGEVDTIRSHAIRENLYVLCILGGIAFSVSLLTSFLLARHLTMPIMELASYVGLIGKKEDGDSDVPSIRRNDEIGMLAQELKALSRNLKETTVSRDHFSKVLNSMSDGVLVTDSNDRIKMLNQAAEQLLNSGPDELLNRPIETLLEIPRDAPQKKDLLETGGELILRSGDRMVPCSISVSRLSGDNQETAGGIFVLHDITERKKAEQIIEAQKEWLDVTLRSIGDGVITTDIDGHVVMMNRIAEELTGYLSDEARNQPLRDIFSIHDEKTGSPRKNPVQQVLATGSFVTLEDDTVLLARNGSKRSIADSCAPIRGGSGELLGAVLVFSDVTEKNRLLHESHKAEKLEALGILAGGIAHDFNNVLTAILGNITFFRLKSAKVKSDIERLKQAEKAIYNARSLTQQLITFAKGGAPITETTSTSELIRETVLFALQGSKVRADFVISDSIRPVKVDIGQMSQVMSNLVFNAIDAMPHGGVLSVTVENADVTNDPLVPLYPGKYVKVVVSDQGEGIPYAVLPKVFDPYFTTKKESGGLGLTTSYSIIKRHGGHINIHSFEGNGTEVTFYLPASSEEPVARSQYDDDGSSAGEGKILVMDDDPMVGDITASLLSHLGFVTVLSTDGEEAIELYKEAFQQKEPFDCVILDLTVPGGIGGKKTMEALRVFDPQVRGIVASGYSNDPIMSNYAASGFKGVLVKPYTLEQMRQVVEGVLKEEKTVAHH